MTSKIVQFPWQMSWIHIKRRFNTAEVIWIINRSYKATSGHRGSLEFGTNSELLWKGLMAIDYTLNHFKSLFLQRAFPDNCWTNGIPPSVLEACMIFDGSWEYKRFHAAVLICLTMPALIKKYLTKVTIYSWYSSIISDAPKSASIANEYKKTKIRKELKIILETE